MRKLVIAEKPSVARDIARVLKCNKRGEGYLYNDDYIVSWAVGHLVKVVCRGFAFYSGKNKNKADKSY